MSCPVPPQEQRAPPRRRLRAAGSLLLLSFAGMPPGVIAASPRSVMPGRRGGMKSRGPPGATSGKDLKGLLHASPDPRDPHADGFVPRLSVDEGGSMWTFGRAHAAVQHVLQNAPAGKPEAVANMLDAFSSEHGLSFGLGPDRGRVIDQAVRSAMPVVAADAVSDGVSESSAADSQRLVLILNSSIGGVALRCLPALLYKGVPGTPHEVVSVESNDHLSDGGARLVAHALSGRNDDIEVRHTPLIPAEDTTLPEVLETLRDGYELGKFHIVFLGGDRAQQRSQLETLLEQGALRTGAVIHGEGPGRGDSGTEGYIEFLEHSGGRFDYEVHDTGPDRVAVVSTVRDRHNAEL